MGKFLSEFTDQKLKIGWRYMQNSLIIARILWPKNNFSEGKKTIKKVKKKVGLKKSSG